MNPQQDNDANTDEVSRTAGFPVIEPGASEAEAAGWEALTVLTGGIPPDQVDELRAVRGLEPIYPLLHALVGRTLRDFFVRAAALEALVQAGRAAFDAKDLAEVLSFLDDAARDVTIVALRRSGWLEHTPAEGTVITEAGRWAYDILAFLHKRIGEAELLPTVAGLDYALRIGVDPIRHLLSMRARLTALRAEIETARASHSEVVLRRTAGRIDDALRLSAQIRAALDQVPLDNPSPRRVARDIHDLLSQLHGAGADLHRDVTEVGRQYLALTGGLTTEQIVRALMSRSCDELAAVGRDALLPVTPPPPLLTTEVLASAAEQQALRERNEPEPIRWEEPVSAPRAAGDEGVPEEVVALVADLAEIVHAGRAVPLPDVVPKGSRTESFFRLSLLALAGDTHAGEGFAGKLGALPLEVAAAGDGWPEALEEKPISRLTPGQVVPRNEGKHYG
jgi:hypothetical protein